MSILPRIMEWLGWQPAQAGSRAVTAAGSASARPTYAPSSGTSTLSWPMQLSLMSRYYRSVPVFGRAVDILAGLAGVPDLSVPDNDAETADLGAWARGVGYGQIGAGLQLWVPDHIGQSLIYGFGVGEMVIRADRRDVERLWSYRSTGFGFKADSSGSLQVVQSGGLSGSTALNPETTLLTVHSPEGCDPHGTALMFSCPTMMQVWTEMVSSIRSTWRRSGVPNYHIHVELPEDFQDDDSGTQTTAIISSYESAWNEAMRSAVMDGRAKDFFTAGVGKVTVEAIGVADQVLNTEEGKRAIVEEIVAATGIPAFLLGYQWSTTERMSRQQTDALTSYIKTIRTEVEPAVRKAADLRQRLSGRRNGLGYVLTWPTVNLQDAVEQARAELMEAQAQKTREETARRIWQAGVYDQQGYADAVTGEEGADIATVMDEPPAAAPVAPQPADADSGTLAAPSPATRAERAEAARREADTEYPGLKHSPDCRCGRRMSSDDPAQLFPSEEPQYDALTREVARVWRATRGAFAQLREEWFEAAGLDDPAAGRAAGARAVDPLVDGRVNRAIDRFLREFAGADRDEDGFAWQESEDGIIQQAEYLSYTIGWQRGQQLTDAQVNLEFTAAQREALLRDAFARLSDDGRLRFETRLTEIRDAMMEGFSQGANPLAIARQLGRDLDGYEAGRLKTICRTEMAFASTSGEVEHYRAAGCTEVEILGDPTTDGACTSRIGNRYALGDTENLPPYHPNCFCDAAPVMPEES